MNLLVNLSKFRTTSNDIELDIHIKVFVFQNIKILFILSKHRLEKIFLKLNSKIYPFLADNRAGTEGVGLPGELGHAQHQCEEEEAPGEEHEAGEPDGGGGGGGVLGRRQ